MKTLKFAESALAKLPPFSSLSIAQQRELLDLATVRQTATGDTYFHEGEKADRFFFLLDGFVRTIRTTKNGEQMVTLLIPPGQLFGVAKAVEHDTYGFTAVAASDGLVLSWPTHLWDRFAEDYPDFLNAARRTLGDRMGELQDRIVELGTKRVEQRIAATMLRLADKAGKETEGGVRIDFPLTRQDISEITGSTLHTVSRVMSNWARKGIVSSKRKQVTLCSPADLELIAIAKAA